MKPSVGSLARLEPLRLWSAALVGCLLVPLAFLGVVRQSSPTFSTVSLQVSIVHSNEQGLLSPDAGGRRSRLPAPDGEGAALRIRNTSASQFGHVEKPTQAETAVEESTGGGSISGGTVLLVQRAGRSQQSTGDRPTPSVNDTRSSPSTGDDNGPPPTPAANETGSHQPEEPAQEGKIICDLSQIRTDFCDLYGDVRINGRSSSVVLASPSRPGTPSGNDSWQIRPYARKWERTLMRHIKEFSVRRAAAGEGTARCTVNHSVPAVVFSTGGLQGNIFHEMADVLIPLFLTSYRYHGEVQFLVTQYRASWVDKFRPMLRRLSRYEVIDVDSDNRVHCFPQATVGLLSHEELGIDPSKPPVGYSMMDFRRFLRRSFSLKREYAQSGGGTKRPRMLFLSRRGSRSLLNEREVIRMARSLGYKVVVATPEATRNLSRFARVVNSCDVLVGVHGAGLTNMLFLPSNGTMVQVSPFGELKYAVRFSYGDPAVGMGLRYLEYEVGMEESSLIKQYPRDHPVLADPMSIHRQGFPAVWSTYIDKQNVTVDVRRFRPFLLQALQPSR